MSNSDADFYRAFEERYYASREFIKTLRKQYLPFIQPLTIIYPGNPTFDIGCGRGEWLELMAEIDFKPYGVDLDDGMLTDCRNLNLPSEKGDAVAFLKTLENESQVCVTAFHVVEHISFEDLQTVAKEALRVLKPGGLLIMETPNPENITVATKNFYLDPTHKRPIPSQLLSFVTEHYGFHRTKVLRLQESKKISESETVTLLNVIDGASPDYAVIAQKEATPEILLLFNMQFATEYGLSLETLATRYETGLQKKLLAIEENFNSLENRMESELQQIEAELQSIHTSRSWRITAPLRWIGHQTRLVRQQGLRTRMKALIKKATRPIVRQTIAFISANPTLRHQCVNTSRRLGIYPYIRSIYLRFLNQNHSVLLSNEIKNPFPFSTAIGSLTPRTQRIYNDLKISIEKNKELQ